eukprot:CAMPEP_0171114870 /NCGR_PEP_ID=MMETSP0766_2-20121228/86375_1 /TAXON_ID=439317 /ORGANISM="Gambierdiscus australes, Strain CAWD 149" /LENGTH=184 /DNA_ID=CAMNT_0011577183 /DNA_START=1 /DNA_END=555 /DNA_ORIENTATION=+
MGGFAVSSPPSATADAGEATVNFPLVTRLPSERGGSCQAVGGAEVEVANASVVAPGPALVLAELASEAVSATEASSMREVEAASSAPPPASEPQPVVVRFGEDVKRLGFEVLWEDERPKVGNVVADGEALKSGLLTGDVLMEIAGSDTLGKSRDELMPLLKVRPLQLNLLRNNGGGALQERPAL